MSQSDFSDLGLNKDLLKAISDLGFEEPSPIQILAIPVLLEGRDMVGQAQTGTGKTAAFGLPILEKISNRSKKTQALVLCPTRELAVQVSEEINLLAAHTRGISILPVYGGQSMDRQLRALQRGAQIVVGTPGRVIDHLERGTLKLDSLQMMVLDEADEMLDMGFREDIERVLQRVPDECQRICFSATMPPAITQLAKIYLREPEFLRVARKEITVPSIDQIYYLIRPHQKTAALCLLLDSQDFNKGIVFCSTKRGVDELTAHLLGHGYQADALHGNLSQSQRDRVMERFRSGGLDLLVATDVAARGLDIDDVDLVINYDIPIDVENYVHRIGRTGRAGRSGKAVTFVTPRESYKVREITRYTKADLKQEQLPSRKDVSEYKTARLMQEVRDAVVSLRDERASDKKIDRYALTLSTLENECSQEELAAALFKLLIERDQIWPSADDPQPEIVSPSLEHHTFEKRDGKGARRENYEKSKAPRDNRNMTRLFFNVGSKGKVTPRDFVGAITGETGLPGRVVGAIEIHDRFSFVEVPSEYAQEIMNVMNKAVIRGMKVAVDIARPQS